MGSNNRMLPSLDRAMQPRAEQLEYGRAQAACRKGGGIPSNRLA